MVDISKIMSKMKLWKYGPLTGAVQTLLRSNLFFISIILSGPIYWPLIVAPGVLQKSSATSSLAAALALTKGVIHLLADCRFKSVAPYGTQSAQDFGCGMTLVTSHWLVCWLREFVEFIWLICPWERFMDLPFGLLQPFPPWRRHWFCDWRLHFGHMFPQWNPAKCYWRDGPGFSIFPTFLRHSCSRSSLHVFMTSRGD